MSDVFNSPLIPAGLREALRFSPDNVPLLVHAAEAVLKVGGTAEAEVMFKRALSLDAANLDAKTGLAATFFQKGADSMALVLVESLTKSPAAPARALALHARLAIRAGEPRLAAQLFARIRETDPAFADPELEQELGNYLPKRPSPVLPPKVVSPLDTLYADAGETASKDGEAVEPDEFDEPQRLPAGDLPDDAAVEMEKPELNFADVGGMDRVKEEIRMKIILPLKQPELFKAYGKKAGGGILLYGPPGCGKTFMARATAGEVNAGFLAVGINDVLDMWIGQSEKNLHAIFEQARSHRPCVLFFDEVDALGANRTDMLKSGGRQMINQFLSELDGVSSSNEGVLILAATNAPWHLDPAFRRPGRFDRIIFVPPPDAPARAAVLRLMLRGKPADAVDFDAVAKKTDGFSGADLKAVVDLAVEAKLTEAMKTGKIAPIMSKDLLEAAKRHKPTVRDWFDTARNYALYANQSGLYDDILAHLKLSK
ncbi:cell division protein [Nibricoccus aquaticus]|uniref:Cell division protein n=1 Tax=Nibricoccus aquaticus TaxID=2576891 RepID=A0A290QCQ3_9BACT|nr:AAA family ATPase [Nibricoccus aquaticus]ATC66037.1 cell division protein [Nibricoccus aquaticus]